METFYDVCSEIWGGCPATKNLEHGEDSADFEVVDITVGWPDAYPRSVDSPAVAYVPDLNASGKRRVLGGRINQPP